MFGCFPFEDVWLLAKKFKDDVAAFKQLGYSNPEYHARESKIKAYKYLLDRGLTPKQAVKKFHEILGQVP